MYRNNSIDYKTKRIRERKQIRFLIFSFILFFISLPTSFILLHAQTWGMDRTVSESLFFIVLMISGITLLIGLYLPLILHMIEGE